PQNTPGRARAPPRRGRDGVRRDWVGVAGRALPLPPLDVFLEGREAQASLVALPAVLVEVAEVLAAELLVLRQVVIAPVRDPFQLADAEWEGVLDVGGRLRVKGEFVRLVVAEPQFVRPEPEVHVPLVPRLPPVGVPLLGFLRVAEELDLHLLELA